MIPNAMMRWSETVDIAVMANAIAANASIKNTLAKYMKKSIWTSISTSLTIGISDFNV